MLSLLATARSHARAGTRAAKRARTASSGAVAHMHCTAMCCDMVCVQAGKYQRERERGREAEGGRQGEGIERERERVGD